ncbi:NADAR family protein [Streptomyces sp. NPDC048604]|uniref:NADAR family protein n=1 Tax=Streptomyces sp. NPDC048604 TaxID=3365578 RepID=UPI0037187B56
MIGKRLIHRDADGVRIPGTWRPAFIRNGDNYFLTDLFIYADGLVDCWGLVALDEFHDQLRSGRIATELPEGGQASAHDLAGWKFAEPRSWFTPDLLMAEVRDTIDRLNGRPDSTGRCLAAVDVFLADRTEENRAAAREAYLAIPETRRRYALGDMDRKDFPLQVLVAGPGGRTPNFPYEPVAQAAYDKAIDYFEDRARWIAEADSRVPADGPDTPHAPAIQLRQSYPIRHRDNPGTQALFNEYPAPIVVDGVTYPTVAHAYWARSVADPADHDAVAAAGSPSAAERLAAEAPRRDGWERQRLAVMTRLLHAKYDQHPDLAAILLATDDATLLYGAPFSDFWGSHGAARNWMGRLLELTRAGLHSRS